jgi:ADP-heptose:LPS heptosyltransferase
VSDAFSLRMPASPELNCHAVDHGLAPLHAVGIVTGDRSTVVVPSPEQAAEAASLRQSLLPAGPYWALHPGAGKKQNLWPADRFAAVAAAVAVSGTPVLVLHGPADGDQLAAFVASRSRAEAGAPVVVAPATSIGTGAALIAGAERFLCNDTGVMHVAGAVGTPTLALFGPTDPDLWKPPGDHVVALKASHRLQDPRGPEFGWMETLTLDAVAAAWRDLRPR